MLTRDALRRGGAVCVLFVAIGISLLATYGSSLHLLSYDEADYVSASLAPFSDRWLSRNTLSFSEFVRGGLSKLGLMAGNAAGPLSVPESGDNFLLRHFHGILPTYYLSLFLSDDYTVESIERGRLYACLVLALAFHLIIGLFVMLRSGFERPAVALVCGILVASSGVWMSFGTFNFHTFLAVLSIPFLVSLRRWVNNPSAKNAALLGAMIAVLFLTLETALVLAGTALLYIAFVLPQRLDIKFLSVLVSAFLLATLVLQPGAFISLDFIKAIGMYAYRLVAKQSAEYGSAAVSETLRQALYAYWPIVLAMLVSFLHVHFFGGGRSIGGADCIHVYHFGRIRAVLQDPGMVESLIGIAYIVFMVPFALNTTYFLPGVVILSWGGLRALCGSAKSQGLDVALALLAMAAFISLFASTPQLAQNREVVAEELRSQKKDLAMAKANCESFDGILASDHAQVFNLYLDRECFLPLVLDYGGQDVLIRIGGRYVPLGAARRSAPVSLMVSSYNEKLVPLLEKAAGMELVEKGGVYLRFADHFAR